MRWLPSREAMYELAAYGVVVALVILIAFIAGAITRAAGG